MQIDLTFEKSRFWLKPIKSKNCLHFRSKVFMFFRWTCLEKKYYTDKKSRNLNKIIFKTSWINWLILDWIKDKTKSKTLWKQKSQSVFYFLQPVHFDKVKPYKDLFIKNRSRTVVTLLLFCFQITNKPIFNLIIWFAKAISIKSEIYSTFWDQET